MTALPRKFASFLLISLVALRCIPEFREPIAPSWDVEFTVPLVDNTWTLNELIQKKPDIVRIDSANLIVYHLDRDVISESIGDRLTLNVETGRTGVRLGPVSIDSVEVSGSVTPFPEGDYPFFPATSVRVAAIPIVAPHLTEATFASGIGELTVRNNLPIPIVLPDPLHLTDGAGRIVATFAITGEIPRGSIRTATDDLTGRTTDRQIRISTTPARDSIAVQTPRDTVNISITSSSRVNFDLSFRDLFVSRAIAQIPQQQLLRADSSLAVIDDSTMIQSAALSRGRFEAIFTNNIDVDVIVRLRLPQFLRPNNTVFDSTVTLGRRDSLPIAIDVRQLRFESPQATNMFAYTLHVSQLGSSGTDHRLITSDDSVTVRMIPEETFVIRSASGVIRPTTLSVEQDFPLDLGELPAIFSVDSLRLPDARFSLGLTTPGFPTAVFGFRVVVSGTDTVRMRNPQPIILFPHQPNRITFDHDNSTIVEVINEYVANRGELPDRVQVLGDALVNHNYNPSIVGFIADTSKIQGSFAVDFPLNVGISNGRVIDTLDIDDKIRLSQDEINRVNRSELLIQVMNNLPCSLSLMFTVLDSLSDSTWSFPRPEAVKVRPGVVGPTGFVVNGMRSAVPIIIDQEDIRHLVGGKYLRTEITLNTSPQQPSVKFRTTDAIKVRVHGTINYRVEPSN